MYGRRKIYTDVSEITPENVVSILDKVLLTHAENQNEIEYLWNYYKGKTPILSKEKQIREEINHKICVNRANEIVTFKLGYGFGEPVQYIRRGKDETLTDDIDNLNEYMFCAKKQARDNTLAEWMFVAGIGIRMVLPGHDEDEPFRIYTLDPRYSFVVRYNGLGEDVVMGVKFVTRENGLPLYSVYTKDWYFEIEASKIVKQQRHTLGDVPLFEYQTGEARLGGFEIALPLLDAINELESNRMDDVVQTVNSFLALIGAGIDEETAQKLEELKMLCLPEGTDAKYLSTPMMQSDIQVQADNMYDAVLTICAIPNRNGGSSTSDTGSAVIMRDGWQNAEAYMKSVENSFKCTENRFLKLVLRIVNDMVGTKLRLKDIEIKMARRNYDNLQTKSQVLVTMLSNPNIHPELAFVHSGLFLDPESAYLQSKEWWEANQQKAQEITVEEPVDTEQI